MPELGLIAKFDPPSDLRHRETTMSDLVCRICSGEIVGSFLTVIVTDEDDLTAGHICSLNCLADYTAQAFTILNDEEVSGGDETQ